MDRLSVQQSNEPGREEVYIQSFPEQGAKQQVSTAGGRIPRWSRDGKELFYLSPSATLMAVVIKPEGASLRVAAPVPLFETHAGSSREGNYLQRAHLARTAKVARRPRKPRALFGTVVSALGLEPPP